MGPRPKVVLDLPCQRFDSWCRKAEEQSATARQAASPNSLARNNGHARSPTRVRMNDAADESSEPTSAEPEFRVISDEELGRILADHKKWLEAEDRTGLDHLRANLSRADLFRQGDILKVAQLRGATCRGSISRGPTSEAPNCRGSISRGPTSEAPNCRGPTCRGPISRGPASTRPNCRGPTSKAPKCRGPFSSAPKCRGPTSRAPKWRRPISI
jgi:hypothetical protein